MFFLFCSIITLSDAPYTVVHVNAAFTRATGQCSAKVLGRPLQDVLKGKLLLNALKESYDGLTSKLVHKQSFKKKVSCSRKTDYLTCSVNVSPVGGTAQGATHFSMELKFKKDDASELCPTDNVTMDSGVRVFG